MCISNHTCQQESGSLLRAPVAALPVLHHRAAPGGCSEQQGGDAAVAQCSLHPGHPVAGPAAASAHHCAHRYGSSTCQVSLLPLFFSRSLSLCLQLPIALPRREDLAYFVTRVLLVFVELSGHPKGTWPTFWGPTQYHRPCVTVWSPGMMY